MTAELHAILHSAASALQNDVSTDTSQPRNVSSSTCNMVQELATSTVLTFPAFFQIFWKMWEKSLAAYCNGRRKRRCMGCDTPTIFWG